MWTMPSETAVISQYFYRLLMHPFKGRVNKKIQGSSNYQKYDPAQQASKQDALFRLKFMDIFSFPPCLVREGEL